MQCFYGHLYHLVYKRFTKGLKTPLYRVITFCYFLIVLYRPFLINKKGILHPFLLICFRSRRTRNKGGSSCELPQYHYTISSCECFAHFLLLFRYFLDTIIFYQYFQLVLVLLFCHLLGCNMQDLLLLILSLFLFQV